MFNLGTQELIVIFAVALLIFGPKKLPEIGKSIGNGIREFKKASSSLMNSIEEDDETK